MKKYYNPVKIIETNNWYFELKRTITSLNIQSPIIITSNGNRKRLELDKRLNYSFIFSDVKSNPTFETCDKVIKFCDQKRIDGVIAIGGGSVMDLAKVVIAKLSLGKNKIRELIDFNEKFTHTIPSVFLPTTHGTASEVTMWGTLWNMKEKKKYSISNLSLYPNIAILDGNLTLSLPLDISITTIMDALSHSFESIWNKNANSKSTGYAIKAICTILDNIDNFKENPLDLEVRHKLLKASTVAGLAFSNTSTAAAHSISYPLTIHYGIPHGVASSISIIPLLDINGKYIKSSLDRIQNKMQITYDELIDKIRGIPNKLIPYTLYEWKVPEEKLPELTDESFTKGRMDNNIIDLRSDDVFNILKKIYKS